VDTIAVTRRFDLTDAQWARLEPLLPKPKKPGRPSKELVAQAHHPLQLRELGTVPVRARTSNRPGASSAGRAGTPIGRRRPVVGYPGRARRSRRRPGTERDFGGNIQAVMRPDGLPIWGGPVEPGSVHDLTRAQSHALGGWWVLDSDGRPVPGIAVADTPEAATDLALAASA
jgi:transposase